MTFFPACSAATVSPMDSNPAFVQAFDERARTASVVIYCDLPVRQLLVDATTLAKAVGNVLPYDPDADTRYARFERTLPQQPRRLLLSRRSS